MKTLPFEPDWVSPPGNTIEEIMQIQNISLEELSIKLDKTTLFVERLLVGKEPICEDLAQKLSDSIGGSKEFWIRRESHFRKDCERLGLEHKYK